MKKRLQENAYFRWFLIIISLVYRFIVRLRNLSFDLGIQPVSRFPVPVISVGNITTGGTGKTPFTIWLAEQLAPAYSKIVVVSRGYGRSSKGVRVVSDGAGRILDPSTGGDEPVMIARRLAGVPVVVAEQRKAGIERAVAAFAPDLIILDDAFQHRHVARDCDIVLIDSRHDLRTEALLPAGMLREPLHNLKRAGLVVYTHCDLSPGAVSRRLPDKYFQGPEACTAHTPECFISARTADAAGLAEMAGKEVAAFAGIAAPERFRSTLEELGLQVRKFAALPDHYVYSSGWLAAFIAETRQLGCRYIVTTEKDLVKLPADIFEDLRLLALRLRLTAAEPEKLVKTIRGYLDISVIRD